MDHDDNGIPDFSSVLSSGDESRHTTPTPYFAGNADVPVPHSNAVMNDSKDVVDNEQAIQTRFKWEGEEQEEDEE